jgi:hypothetical protein
VGGPISTPRPKPDGTCAGVNTAEPPGCVPTPSTHRDRSLVRPARQFKATAREVRCHLGFETQRERRNTAIQQLVPALIGAFLDGAYAIRASKGGAEEDERRSVGRLVAQAASDLRGCNGARHKELRKQTTFCQSPRKVDTAKRPMGGCSVRLRRFVVRPSV